MTGHHTVVLTLAHLMIGGSCGAHSGAPAARQAT